MKGKKKKVLIVGDAYDNHILRFEKYLALENIEGNVEFNLFNINKHHKIDLFDKSFQLKSHFPLFFYKFRFINTICEVIDCYLSFNYISNYDLINIHFVTIHSFYLLPLFKIKARKIMISPWGSDVYRISKKLKMLFQKIYNAADYVSAAFDIKFKEDIKDKFAVPEYKFVNLGFGSEIIDRLNNEKMTKTVAKKKINVDNSFVVTCGYNRNKAQNHLDIINSLIEVKDLLPKNTILFFPMTYGPVDDKYFLNIENILSENNFTYKIFKEYLSLNEQLTLRFSTDLLIHIQDSDANSATIQEHLLCNTDVINGNWLRYPQFEKYGIPYYIAESKNSLSTTLKEYLESKKRIIISDELINEIKLNSWSVKIKDWYNFFISTNF